MTRSVAILGATGIVGQMAIALLRQNPNFVVQELIGSSRRMGQSFASSNTWRAPLECPNDIAQRPFDSLKNIQSDVVLSCLPAPAAQQIEPDLLAQGKWIFSNASAFRQAENIPLVIPEINPSHLSMIDHQQSPGRLICNPNCAAVGISLALAPLTSITTIAHVGAVTLQSISGAGYPGLSALDISANTIPYIAGEAEKITQETQKILGSSTRPATFSMTTQVNRVPTHTGHSACLQIECDPMPDLQTLIDAYQQVNTRFPNTYVIHQTDGHPNPRRDLTIEDMRVHIGHIQCQPTLGRLSLVVLTHNLVRGAAGAAIANLNAACQAGYL